MDHCEILIDSHITDWKKEFQSKLSPKNYADMIALAGTDSSMVYASCHNGNCYYPTKIGHMHKNLKGRDVFGEIFRLLEKKGIGKVAYYSLIYNNWAYKNFPEWRMVNASGKPAAENSRYGILCPNSPYRDFAAKQLKELCENYDFKRIFLDMTFWPVICYCSHCAKRFKSETGKELPKTINWEGGDWLIFTRKREEWLNEFAAYCTWVIKKIKPGTHVTHQFSPCLLPWTFGVTQELQDHCDYASGDFYGDSVRHSLACKVFLATTKNRPFEFFVSRCIGLHDHTTMKTFELLEAQAMQVIAHSGRIIFIDAINPDGTLEKEFYSRVRKVSGEVKKYRDFLGGEPVQDIGVYLSFESKISLDDSGKETASGAFSGDIPHLNSVINTCKTLMSSHVPFGIVTKKDLRNLSRFKALVLPDVVMMDSEEAGAIREYVRNGGAVYASKYTSLYDKYKGRKNDFMLSDVLGVSFEGITNENITYITPKEKSFGPKHLIIFDKQIKVKKKSGRALAGLTLPYTNPSDASRFASIHSNPPGIESRYPAIIFNKFGKGMSCYVSAALERQDPEGHRKAFVKLLGMLAGNKYSFGSDAPGSVELLMFRQTDKSRYILNFVNFQQELPNIPVRDIRVKVRLPGNERPSRLVILPENKKLKFSFKGNALEFRIPELKTFLMCSVHTGKGEK